jgi:hypothetical protein
VSKLNLKRKEYIGDAIIHLALSQTIMTNLNKSFHENLQIIHKLQSNSNLADVAKVFNINPTQNAYGIGYKKYANAVEIHVYDLYEEYGLEVAIEWVKKYIVDYTINTKQLIKNKRKENK